MEFAIVIIPLILIVFGVTEFGRALAQYNTLAKSARNAARYLSTLSPVQTNTEAEQDKAACLAVYEYKYVTACTGTPLAQGLTTDMVQVTTKTETIPDPSNPPTTISMDFVTVTISTSQNPYSFVSVVPFVVPNINFGPISVTMRQI